MELLITEKDFLKRIPGLPGVYRFYGLDSQNDPNELLYVGKAINLAKRVKSYFQRSRDLSPRIGLMVTKIVRLELTVTENEVSALILESNLIKNLKPKYNIIFRDDKTYPLIKITNHEFPKVESYRGQTNTQNYFFGPYPNAYAVKQAIDTIGKLFKIRTCTEAFFKSRTRPCMLYEIKRCTAPCVNYVNAADYKKQINQAVDFLEGRYSAVIESLTYEMFKAAEKMEFEVAAAIRDKLALLKQISQTQIINNHNKPISTDLILTAVADNKVFVYLIIIRNGIYVGDNNFILANPDNNLQEVLSSFLEQYYIDERNTRQVHLLDELSAEFRALFSKAFNIKINLKLTPELAKLHQMGQINLQKIIDEKAGGAALVNAAAILAEKLGITKIERMECIDISHNHGENAVASLVVYQSGIVDSSKYRKYNLNQEVQGNDLLGMQIVLTRRLASTTMPLPDVILVDGGQLQLDAVKNILEQNHLYGKIRAIAIFKGEKRDPLLDRLMLDDGKVIAMFEAKELFKLIQLLRDEAHRFAITGHRKKQIHKMTVSKLAELPNIGTQKRRALIAHFGSVRNVAHASVDDLRKVNGIGEVLANQIYSYFH